MCKAVYKHMAYQVAKEMIVQLKNNEHKGDRANWVNVSNEELIKELKYHTFKLETAISNNNKNQIKEYAADVANIAGMIMDANKVINLDKIDPISRKKSGSSQWDGS